MNMRVAKVSCPQTACDWTTRRKKPWRLLFPSPLRISNGTSLGLRTGSLRGCNTIQHNTIHIAPNIGVKVIEA